MILIIKDEKERSNELSSVIKEKEERCNSLIDEINERNEKYNSLNSLHEFEKEELMNTRNSLNQSLLETTKKSEELELKVNYYQLELEQLKTESTIISDSLKSDIQNLEKKLIESNEKSEKILSEYQIDKEKLHLELTNLNSQLDSMINY
jgi:hypothetical protein